jgi:glycosyltransferase involved in cell wall biosynthesis
MAGGMRILLVDDTLNVGGKERLVLTSLKCLPRDRMTVHLCLIAGPGALGDEAIALADGTLVCGRKSPYSPGAVRLLRRYVIDKGIDLLHCNGTVDLLHAYAATRGLSAKLVCSVHGYASGIHRLLGKFLLARCDAVMPVSSSLLSDLRNEGYRSRLFRVVPNCYDPAFENPEPRLGPAVPGRLSLVCVSRFDWSKDQLTIVRAMKAAVDQGRDVTLDFAGSGPERYIGPVTRAASDLGLASRVRFLGTRRDVADLLPRYDAFILSSFAESFGIAAVEAMACGLPVLLSDIPSFREITRDGEDGLLFATGSPESAAAAISTLCDDLGARAELAARALARSREYSPRAFAARLSDLYSSLLGEGGP